MKILHIQEIVDKCANEEYVDAKIQPEHHDNRSGKASVEGTVVICVIDVNREKPRE